MLVNYYRRSLSMMTDCLRPKLIARFVQLRYSKKHECHFVTFRVRIDSSAWTVNPPTSPRKVWHASGKQRNNLYSQKIPQLSSTATLKLPSTEMNGTIFLISGLKTFSFVLSFITFFRSIITVSSFRQTSWFQNVWGVSRVRGCHTKLNCSIAKTTEL